MGHENDVVDMTRNGLAKEMAGEIVLSSEPESVIKKWRDIFKISQKELAERLGITSSVVSDYESGRRKSPGIRVIRKYVDALLDIDVVRGGHTIRSFTKDQEGPPSEAVIDVKGFEKGITVDAFSRRINAPIIAGGGQDTMIYGYMLIDSLKAITEFTYQELLRFSGTASRKALIFTKVQRGRTPMVAIKLTNIRPALVVMHGSDCVDDVAKRIADVEKIPLALCRLDKEEQIEEALGKLK